MTQPDPESLRTAIQAMTDHLAERPGWGAEVARARREFHGEGGPSTAGNAEDLAAAEARCTEWILFERPSVVLGDVPVRVLAGRASDDPDLQEALVNSLVGAFMVRQGEGELAQTFDVQSEERVEVRTARDAARPGDLLVGRLFPDGDGVYWPSPNISLQRGAVELAQALHIDIQKVSPQERLGQADLERVLFQQLLQAVAQVVDAVPLEYLEADLAKLLEKGGVEDASGMATDSTRALRATDNPSTVIGPLLDGWAFESDVDLEAARQLLWKIVSARPPAAPGRFATPGESEAGSGKGDASGSDRAPGLGAAAAKRIQEGLAAGEDLEALFREVADLIGVDAKDLDPEQAGDDTAEQAVVDAMAGEGGVGPEGNQGLSDPGDLEPLVEEYLWELDQGLTPRLEGLPPAEPGASLRLLVELQQQHPVPRTTLDRLDGEDLCRLYLHRYLHNKPDRAFAVRTAHAVMGAFLNWCVETQEIDCRGALQAAAEQMVEPVDRLTALGAALSDGAEDGSAKPSLVRLDGPSGGVLRATVEQMGDVELEAPESALALARPADVLLGGLLPVRDGRTRFVGEVVALTHTIEKLLG